MKTLEKTSWLSYYKPNPQAEIRLFCFPYAGGSALIYRKWAGSLPKNVEICPVQLPGRGTRLRDQPFTRLIPMVETLAAALLPYLDRPFAFFGHSMGAAIAFELARHLRQRYLPEPEHLFVSGRNAPQIPRTTPLTYHLPDSEFIEEVRRLNGTPQEVLEHPELMQLMLPLLRTDFAVVQTYIHATGEPLSAPITAFGGLLDHDVRREYLEAWSKQTAARFSLRMFPGDHFFLHTSQALVLKALAQDLNHTATRLSQRLSA
jgi:medium-chain acyl-[acyl-carrier-protein] hydrolase